MSLFTLSATQYYVYHHLNGEEVFYVGMGRGDRAFDYSDPSRGRKWKEYFATMKPGDFSIRIVSLFPTREAALVFENKEIKKLRPQTNSHGLRKIIVRRKYQGPPMTMSQAGLRGALITNKLLTSEGRRKAAKKGWRLRRKRLGRV